MNLTFAIICDTIEKNPTTELFGADHDLAMGSVICKLSLVHAAIWRSLTALAMPLSVQKVTLIGFACTPLERAPTTKNTIDETTSVLTAIREFNTATTMHLPGCEISLVDLSIWPKTSTSPMRQPVTTLTGVDGSIRSAVQKHLVAVTTLDPHVLLRHAG